MTDRTLTRIVRLVGLAIGATLVAAACSNQGEAVGVANGAAIPDQLDASTTVPTTEAPTTEAPTTEAPGPAADAERPSQEELAAILAVSIAGTPAGEQLSVDQINCIAGVLIDGQLPDHVLRAVVNNSPTLTEAEDRQLRQQSEAATIVCG